MKLPDLIAKAADPRVTPRFVRYLIAEGVVPAPRGGRAHAEYGDDHLDGVRRYLSLRDVGTPIAAIKAMDAGRAPDKVPHEIAPGVTLVVRSAELDPALQPRAVARQVEVILAAARPGAAPKSAKRR